MKLKSLKDLEIPRGLFPKEETESLEKIKDRAITFYNFNPEHMMVLVSYDDIICIFHELVLQLIPSMKESASNSSQELNNISEFFNLTLASLKLDGIQDGLENDTLFNKKSSNTEFSFQTMCSLLSLSEYLKGIEKAKSIKKNNGVNNNAYYRLGKSYKNFNAANEALLLSEQMSHEIKGVMLKEDAVKAKRSNTSRKAGKKRNEKYDVLKKKVLQLYNEKYQKRSNRDAAHRIAKDLSEDIATVMQTLEPEITIAKWIGTYNKTSKSNT